MRAASRVNDRVMAEMVSRIHAGVRENELGPATGQSAVPQPGADREGPQSGLFWRPMGLIPITQGTPPSSSLETA
jgi:hypothetical protein